MFIYAAWLKSIVARNKVRLGNKRMTIDLAGTIGPIITQITGLMPAIVDLVVAVIPAIVTLAVVGFVIGFLSALTGKLKL
jgi:hypothetical protein